MDNSDKVPNYKFVHKFIDEKQLISRLVMNERDELNVSLFANLIYDPIHSSAFSTYKGFFVFQNVLRKELGFDNEQKPGDFDILIIPYTKDNIFFDRTCAFEVKVVRPNRLNPRKPPKSYGEEQLNGLIRDGFPLVGLFHICMT